MTLKMTMMKVHLVMLQNDSGHLGTVLEAAISNTVDFLKIESALLGKCC